MRDAALRALAVRSDVADLRFLLALARETHLSSSWSEQPGALRLISLHAGQLDCPERCRLIRTVPRRVLYLLLSRLARERRPAQAEIVAALSRIEPGLDRDDERIDMFGHLIEIHPAACLLALAQDAHGELRLLAALHRHGCDHPLGELRALSSAHWSPNPGRTVFARLAEQPRDARRQWLGEAFARQAWRTREQRRDDALVHLLRVGHPRQIQDHETVRLRLDELLRHADPAERHAAAAAWHDLTRERVPYRDADGAQVFYVPWP